MAKIQQQQKQFSHPETDGKRNKDRLLQKRRIKQAEKITEKQQNEIEKIDQVCHVHDRRSAISKSAAIAMAR